MALSTALSIFTESEAPRDFRVSSTESDGHYKKCLLCYTVKKNFYCPDCIRAGNFVHSSMPYSDREMSVTDNKAYGHWIVPYFNKNTWVIPKDHLREDSENSERFAEKQAKLLRIKANRRHVLDRCEKLLAPKVKRDSLITETKQSRDKINLLRLAIEQRKSKIDERKKELSELQQYNNELKLKLPRYQKRVGNLEKHAHQQRTELQNKVCAYNDRAEALAALRRSRIRQLTKYIFPVYVTFDSSDSIEDMEFIGDDIVEEPPKKPQLHIVAPWINADGDFSHVEAWVAQNKESASVVTGAGNPLQRSASALGLCAQLAALLAYTLDARLPHTLALSEYCNWRVSVVGLSRRYRRLCACCAGLCARAGLAPLTPLAGLEALTTAAQADCSYVGRVCPWVSVELAEAWAAREPCGLTDCETDLDEPPEHLHWPEQEPEELSCTPPAQPASLVTSAAASIVSMWRGWTK